jgi:uncharacterized hydrophobic protein (TIGR00341 family)
MPLRLLELTLPEEAVARLDDLLEEYAPHDVSRLVSAEGTVLLRILIDGQRVEGLTDAMMQQVGSTDEFRIVSLPVEATLPRLEEEDDEQAEGEGTEEEQEPAAPRISREELYEDLVQASRLTLVYAVMVTLSTIVAAVGLIRDNVAIVIGAMVIAPLLGPNVALALASSLGDMSLAKRSLKALSVGLAIALAVSLAIGAVLGVDPSTRQIATRTQADFPDIALALAAGAAGSLAFTSGVSAVLVGVMVSVALLPPVVTAGLLAGAGQGALALGALLLLATNVACVNLAAVATFLVQKVRPRSWWEAEQAKRATRLAVLAWVGVLAILIGLMLLQYLGIV